MNYSLYYIVADNRWNRK